MSTLVQSATGAFTATLPSAPTPGNLLVMCSERGDGADNGSAGVPSPGAGWAQLDSGGHGYFQAHPAFGGRARLCVKIVQAGDTAGPYTAPASATSVVLAEIAPSYGTTERTQARAFLERQASAAVSLACGANVGPALVIGGVATRLNGGILTPAAGVNVVPVGGVLPGGSHDRAGILWRDGTGGATTLAGTQSGATQDGYAWGIQVVAFGPAPDTGFPPRFW